MITRTRIEYDIRLVYYDTTRHTKTEQPVTLLLGSKDDPLRAAWEMGRNPGGNLTLSDVKVEGKRKVTFFMLDKTFYSLAEKTYD